MNVGKQRLDILEGLLKYTEAEEKFINEVLEKNKNDKEFIAYTEKFLKLQTYSTLRLAFLKADVERLLNGEFITTNGGIYTMGTLSVKLDDNYTKELKQEIQELIRKVISEEKEKIEPTKRYYNRRELMEFLSIGASTIEKLQIHGLQYVPVGRQVLFDIEQVYEVLDSLKK